MQLLKQRSISSFYGIFTPVEGKLLDYFLYILQILVSVRDIDLYAHSNFSSVQGGKGAMRLNLLSIFLGLKAALFL